MKTLIPTGMGVYGPMASLIVVLVFHSPASGQPSSSSTFSFWRPDGPVHAIAVHDGKVFLGGDFSYVGPASGSAGEVSLADAHVSPGFPVIDGTVSAIAPDGSGGWFVGGTFTRVGNSSRTNLVHIRADRSVDNGWKPDPNGNCKAVVLDGGQMYVGGEFNRIGGQTRNRIASLDAATGEVSAWNPNSASTVNAILPSGNRVYVGGIFVGIGGQTRNRIAVLDATTGKALPWNPNANNAINALAMASDTLYIAGNFTTIGGKPRNRVAAIDVNTAEATAWNPNANAAVQTVVVDGSTVYLGGLFASVGGQNRRGLASVDTATGSATAWDPAPDGPVYALARLETRLVVGGQFTEINGQARIALAAIDTATGATLPWVPRISSFIPSAKPVVNAIGWAGESIGFGGNLVSSGGVARQNLAALDVESGSVLPWNPAASGVVSALLATSNRVYVGGAFTNVGGLPRAQMAAVDPITGEALDWDPAVIGRNPSVSALALGSDVLYVGGTFTNIGHAARTSIAALALDSAAATDWNPRALGAANNPGSVQALVLSQDTLYVGGDFINIAGQPRQRIAALQTTSDHALEWNPGANGVVSTLALNAGTLYVGGAFTSIGGQVRNRIAAVDAATGSSSGWNPDASGGATPRVAALQTHGDRLYVSGQFTSLGGEFRNRLSSLEAQQATATSWNPNLNGLVRALAVTSNAVFAGGDFTGVGKEELAYFAVFSLAPAFTPTLTKPTGGPAAFQFTSGDGDQIALQASSDLQQWETISTQAVLNKPIDFSDVEAGSLPHRFYRLLLTTPP